MKTLTQIEEIKNGENYAIGLELPQLKVYLTWNGGKFVEYHAFRNDTLLFHGTDFKPSAFDAPDSRDAAISLLGFLTCQPGDTDNSYFANYTEDQQFWAQSQDCEDLAAIVMAYEDKNDEAHENAVKLVINSTVAR